jgi:hypothetical protein
VVLLEILTGRHPLDPTLPGGAHLVQWAREHVQAKHDLLDPRLTRPGAAADVQEIRQVLSVAALCVAPRDDRRRGAAQGDPASRRRRRRRDQAAAARSSPRAERIVELLVRRVGLLRLTRNEILIS